MRLWPCSVVYFEMLLKNWCGFFFIILNPPRSAWCHPQETWPLRNTQKERRWRILQYYTTAKMENILTFSETIKSLLLSSSFTFLANRWRCQPQTNIIINLGYLLNEETSRVCRREHLSQQMSQFGFLEQIKYVKAEVSALSKRIKVERAKLWD